MRRVVRFCEASRPSAVDGVNIWRRFQILRNDFLLSNTTKIRLRKSYDRD